MLRAIDEYEIDGPSTTLSFGRFAFKHEAFVSGNFDTHFVKKHFSPELIEQGSEEEAKIAAMLVAHLLENRLKKPVIQQTNSTVISRGSNWKNRAK
jgi:propionyl-CoA carboxylase alpha chain